MPLTQVQGGMLAGSTNTTTTIQSNGTTAITIDSSQNVLIGGTTFDNGGFAGGANGLNVVDATHPIVLIKESTTGTKAFFGVSSTLSYLWTPNNISLAFGTNDTERMRISEGAGLQVGTSSLSGGRINAVNASGIWVQKLQDTASNGAMIQFVTPGGSQAGSITISGATTSYGSGSDYRLKDDIQPLSNALSKVELLKPVTWKWKADNTNGQGFVAHELAEVVPDAVVGEKDAVDENGEPKYQMVDTSFLVATLTAAIQELKGIVDTQAAEIAALKAK